MVHIEFGVAARHTVAGIGRDGAVVGQPMLAKEYIKVVHFMRFVGWDVEFCDRSIFLPG